jgi:hypothetical protein
MLCCSKLNGENLMKHKKRLPTCLLSLLQTSQKKFSLSIPLQANGMIKQELYYSNIVVDTFYHTRAMGFGIPTLLKERSVNLMTIA